ncbi:MAG: hypothetical protein U0163_16150 [Gemmatimonadaceae bacterium]
MLRFFVMRNCLFVLCVLVTLGAAGPHVVIAQRGLPAAIAAAPVPDDSPASRAAAMARLRAAVPADVCADSSKMSRTYGTTCASREFQAPPLLAPPTMVWETKPGWWGVWSPFLVGDLMLTGSCNNDGGEGLSALDMKTGRGAGASATSARLVTVAARWASCRSSSCRRARCS